MLQNEVDDRVAITQTWENLAKGESGDVELERAYLRKAQELFDVFCKKQHDYGPYNIGISGMAGVTIRAADKVSRLFELLGIRRMGEQDSKADVAIRGRAFKLNPKESNNESIRDSFLDMANYGIIAMLVHDNDWIEASPSDAWELEES